MEKNLFQMHHYQITEYANGSLWWEAHSDFGMQKGGECFIWGSILLINPWSEEKIGLLIGEFLDSLKKLPHWNKTNYYCFVSELLVVKTGRKPSAEFIKKMYAEQVKNSGQVNYKDIPSGSYRIDRYLIIINEDQTISWRTSGHFDQIHVGKAFIESGILFLESNVVDESKQKKREFISTLSKSPNWNITLLWCRHSALRSCREKEPVKFSKIKSIEPPASTHPISPEPIRINLESSKKETRLEEPEDNIAFPKSPRSYSNWLSNIKNLRPNWSLPQRFKIKWLWVGLILLVIIGLIVAGIIGYHEIKKTDHYYKFEKNYRKYHH
jgi:hypothetical protein